MNPGVILIAALIMALVAAATSFGLVLYFREDSLDVEPITPHGWWELPEFEFDHDAVQLAADQSCEIEPSDLVRDGLGGQS